MGCLVEILWHAVGYFLLLFFFPWFEPEPDEYALFRRYRFAASAAGAVAAGCWAWGSFFHPQGLVQPALQWLALGLGAYFALLMLYYWPRAR
ncbi:MAG: hypothetical protein ACYC7E_18705 [Armatimonadota bacterium]